MPPEMTNGMRADSLGAEDQLTVVFSNTGSNNLKKAFASAGLLSCSSLRKSSCTSRPSASPMRMMTEIVHREIDREFVLPR